MYTAACASARLNAGRNIDLKCSVGLVLKCTYPNTGNHFSFTAK